MIDNIENIFLEYFDRIAINIDGKKITYNRLLNDAKELSKKLYGCNTNVIVYGHKEYYMIVAFIACLLANKTYIPIDISVPKNRIRKIIDDSKSELIITEYDGFNLTNILKDNANYGKDKKSEFAYIMYTSGSTGNPKGVPISRTNLNNFINWISNSELKKYKKITVFNQANFNFDLSIMDIYYSIFNGHTLVITSKDLFVNINDIYIILKRNINMLVVTPSFFNLLMINNEFNSENYKDIECIFFCGETLDKNLVKRIYDRFKNIEIINAYGPTEATCAVTFVKIEKHMLKNNLPIGIKTNAACNISVNNSEIILSGKSVFNGYLNSNMTITKYKTGDYGFFKDGLLYFNGRRDDTIKLNGYRINLNDIKNNILNIEGVIDAIVYTRKKDKKIIRIESKVVLIDKRIDVKKELSLLLPKYMVPKKIYIVDKINLNNNMKKEI